MELIKTLNKVGDKTYINFYLKLDNGNLIAIKPKYFDKGDFKESTFKELNALAKLVD